ncbi:type I-E CRISPR-associated protein Cas6/Cse3/CasE [Halothiobacillus diazotrophicus]|uniref:Type I-E CRISPR-associated protein Cas6/Cse3/CasE n=1 Tax=Halothiobacillus diazotrophicus TaxID=1860122 RepID=A0A191ZHL2_9GAMM|nr:type I-E CRISPR-associated protein Cas6/Cse3/CasE [Halothiobacillus diazotrophicus]ANJ67342.1 type I-E CRISPR-associated protein Cas6/Cse3/CasE [Halothiobacillus diazotrophicus]
MRLHRITLNPRSKAARRDLADPYQMHATLCRAFFPEHTPSRPGALLWRLEPETDRDGRPRVLIQSQVPPEWSPLYESGWLAVAEPGIDLVQKLSLDTLSAGQVFRFRLRANPCKTLHGKRLGLLHLDAQHDWLARKGQQHGFSVPSANTPDYFDFLDSPKGRAYPDVRVSQDQMLVGRRHDGRTIRVFSVLYEGRLVVSDPAQFRAAIQKGIGHAKVMGLGLLSVVPSQR